VPAESTDVSIIHGRRAVSVGSCANRYLMTARCAVRHAVTLGSGGSGAPFLTVETPIAAVPSPVTARYVSAAALTEAAVT
jgi:hypothetical protein